MSDVAIAAGFVVVALLRLWCSYRWSRSGYLHDLYGQGHVRSLCPLPLIAAEVTLAIAIGIRLYAAMPNWLGVILGILAVIAAHYALLFCQRMGVQVWWIRVGLAASEEEKSKLLGFSSVEEMHRVEAAASGYSSVEEMHEQQEESNRRLVEMAEKGQEVLDQARTMASSGVPIDRAGEVIGEKYGKAIERCYKEVEESRTGPNVQ